MPATLNIDQTISSQLVVSTTDSLFFPSIRESVRRRFHSLIQNPPFHRISFACLPYLTTSHQIPNLPPNQSLPSQKDTPASNQPLPTKKPQTSSSPRKKKEERKKKGRKKWNTTVPSTEALPVGASTCVLVGPEPIVEVMGFPIRLLRNFLIL